MKKLSLDSRTVRSYTVATEPATARRMFGKRHRLRRTTAYSPRACTLRAAGSAREQPRPQPARSADDAT